MTAIEFFEKEKRKAESNYLRAVIRNANDSEKENLRNKVDFYSQAIAALQHEKGE